MSRHIAAAACLWLAAWICAGFIPASYFTARKGKLAAARAELAGGILGAAGLAWAGAAAW